MRRALLLPFLFALALAVPCATAQPAAKPDIAGTLKMTFRGLGVRAADYEEVIEGTIRFTHWMSNPLGGDLYRIGSDVVVWRASGRNGECTYTGSPVSILLGPGNASGIVTINAEGGYTASLRVNAEEVAGAVTATCTEADGSVVVTQAAPLFTSALETGSELRQADRDAAHLQGSHTNARPGAVGVTEWTWSLSLEPASTPLAASLKP